MLLVQLREATQIPAGLLRHSEDLDPDAPGMKPDLVEPDYDDAAFAEALADLAPDPVELDDDDAFAEALADHDEAGENPW
jgi:hypothetical protein